MTVLVSKQKAFQVLLICKMFSILEKRMTPGMQETVTTEASQIIDKNPYLKQSRLFIRPETLG